MSKGELLALYERQQSNGLTIKDFCDNESYSASCYHYWKKKYGLSHPYNKHTEPTDDSFVPFNINHTPAISALSCDDNSVTIELPSGIKIYLNSLSNSEIIYGLISKLCSHVLSNDMMRYFLCLRKTDMRKGINSLCGVVRDKMEHDVRLGDVFIG